jgi:hypothetical protein
MPATVDTLKIYLGLDPASTVDAQAMQMACDAANDIVTQWRPDLTDVAAGATWPPRAEQAAVVQAARLYGRRGSVSGIAAFADLGIANLARMDPEVRSLLQLGEFQMPVVA